MGLTPVVFWMMLVISNTIPTFNEEVGFCCILGCKLQERGRAVYPLLFRLWKRRHKHGTVLFQETQGPRRVAMAIFLLSFE